MKKGYIKRDGYFIELFLFFIHHEEVIVMRRIYVLWVLIVYIVVCAIDQKGMQDLFDHMDAE